MEEITLVKEAVHRPDEPRHFMEYTYPEGRYVARVDGVVIADTTRIMKLSEVGYHIYDPVLYFPLDDAVMGHLDATAKSSHCPLKGDTHYFDFVDGGSRRADIGWCYSRPLDFAQTLSNYVAFDRSQVDITSE